ncbi:MAG: alpha/beta hydrolase [Rhizobiaceae bacterium]
MQTFQTFFLVAFLSGMAFLAGAQPTHAAAADEADTGTMVQTVQVGAGLRADVYTPPAPAKAGLFALSRPAKAPVLLYVHGGGWIKGERGKVYNLPAYAASRGYVLISVDYRPVPRTNIDGQVSDVVRGISWTRANIAKYGGDPGKIVIMGHSAGSHLVALIAARKLGGALRGVVANDVQAYDLIAYEAMRGGMAEVYRKAFGSNPANWLKWSPVTYVRKASGFPPFLVMASRSDRPRRAQLARAFVGELKRKGTKVSYFDGARYTHGSIASTIGTSSEVTGALDRFLASVFR